MKETLPFVSVLMPVRNEGLYMERALKAVLEQDYPADKMEIIVADGRSTDGTRERVLEIAKKTPGLRLVDNPGKIVSPGLNAAMKAAKGEIIVRVDGHCEIAPDYVSRCVDYLSRGLADGVSGPIKTIGETFMARAIALAMSSNFGVGGSAFRVGTDRAKFVDTVAFPAYRRDMIEKAGPYDETLVRNQDDEYNYRLRKMGYRLLLAPDIHSRYYSRASLRGLWNQYFQYGYWKVRVLKKHPRQLSLRQFVPVLFVLGMGLSAVYSVFFDSYVFAVIAGVYLMLNLGSSLRVSLKSGLKYFPVLPFIFLTLHASYGAGFLKGIVSGLKP